MSNEPEIDNPPNTAPPVERVWMFVSRDAEGRENACGARIGDLGWQPLITGNPKILEIHKVLARKFAYTVPDKTIHLLVFTKREEIEEW